MSRSLRPRPLRRLAAALALLLGLGALAGTLAAGPAGACELMPAPDFAELAASDGPYTDALWGELVSVTKVEHRADNGEATASVSVAARHWGPEAPTEPQTGTLHDDTDYDIETDPCGYGQSARREGSVEYRATFDHETVELRGRPDEATLTRLLGAPVDPEIDEPAVAEAIDTMPGPDYSHLLPADGDVVYDEGDGLPIGWMVVGAALVASGSLALVVLVRRH